MSSRIGRDLMHRYEGNPIITVEDIPFRCSDICNAGAVKLGRASPGSAERDYLLLVTIEGPAGRKAIYPAWSGDGYHFSVNEKPFLAPSREGPLAEYEPEGVLDPRIVLLEGSYYFSYHALSNHGYVMAVARTSDFREVERLGIISEPDTKSGALFPEKIGGRYARLEKPSEGGSLWISYSEDLIYWGWSNLIIGPRRGQWDSDRVGPATPPVRVPHGWLCIYYGVKMTSAGPLYRLGAIILDRQDPAKVLGRTTIPILAPRENYERLGDIPNMVFACGAVLEEDNLLRLYYGGSDSCICLATAPLDAIVEECRASTSRF